MEGDVDYEDVLDLWDWARCHANEPGILVSAVMFEMQKPVEPGSLLTVQERIERWKKDVLESARQRGWAE